MKHAREVVVSMAGALAFGLLVTSFAHAQDGGGRSPGTPTAARPATPADDGGGLADAGPDVIVSKFYDMDNYGTVSGISSYALGATACNIGTFHAEWLANTAHHPVIGGNLYRLKTVNGASRLEQIGMSWLKHSFCAADEDGNGAGQLCPGTYVPDSSCNYLGLHANDTYWAGLNGDQTSLGPRSEVNPYAGTYTYPPNLAWGLTGNATYKRLQVHASDIDPAQNSGATYYGEVQYVCTDEPAGNRFNNLTYRQILVGAANGAGWNLSLGAVGTQHQQEPAINAWRAGDGSVVLQNIDVVGDGRMILGYRVTNLGGGQWHYEYALYNQNCDRAAQALFIPSNGIVPTNVGFHDVDYHSGEPYSLTDWTPNLIGGLQSWSSETYASNINANALRWGTLYNFRFDANYPPKFGTASINIFKPGSPTGVSARVLAPSRCLADVAPGNGVGDGVIDVNDLLAVVTAWGPCPNPNDCPGDIAPAGGNDVVDVNDLLAVVSAWGPCPP